MVCLTFAVKTFFQFPVQFFDGPVTHNLSQSRFLLCFQLLDLLYYISLSPLNIRSSIEVIIVEGSIYAVDIPQPLMQ